VAFQTHERNSFVLLKFPNCWLALEQSTIAHFPWVKEAQLEAITNLNDEFDAMTDFGIHLEFDMNDLEETDANEITWQDLCDILLG
jgi:hypothetical protein